LKITAHFYNASEKTKIPFKTLMRDAYIDGADYLVRVNADTEYNTMEWSPVGVDALRAMEPSNVSVVGPLDRINEIIITHDVVHRTHLSKVKC
jgi:hypothetical protein